MNTITTQAGDKVTTDHGWVLYRWNDSMTDKITCSLTPVGKPYAHFSKRGFMVSYKQRGGVQGYKYRLDDRPAAEYRLAEGLEEDSDTVIFAANDFNSLLEASRLRLVVRTVLGETSNDDFDLTGMHGLFAKMRQECPD